jgi:hypothetical protein
VLREEDVGLDVGRIGDVPGPAAHGRRLVGLDARPAILGMPRAAAHRAPAMAVADAGSDAR